MGNMSEPRRKMLFNAQTRLEEIWCTVSLRFATVVLVRQICVLRLKLPHSMLVEVEMSKVLAKLAVRALGPECTRNGRPASRKTISPWLICRWKIVKDLLYVAFLQPIGSVMVLHNKLATCRRLKVTLFIANDFASSLPEPNLWQKVDVRTSWYVRQGGLRNPFPNGLIVTLAVSPS